MAINLPNNPTNGQTVTLGNKTLVYSTSLSVWQIQSSPSGATVTTSDTAPASPSDGDMWFDSATLNTFIYYSDGSSNQWVKANPSGSTGPQGIQGVAGSDGSAGADGASGGNGIATIVADMAALIALTGMSAGAQAFVNSNNKLYFYNGSGWYLIATVQNEAPSAITGVDGAYELAVDGASTVITAVSTDPEGFPLTWSFATSGLGSIATVGQGTGAAYAIANASLLSGTYAVNANAGALTFKPDGTKMYYVGTNNDRVNQFDLSTAWDVSTASYDDNFSVQSQALNLTDVKFNNDGTKMYAADRAGTTDNTIYQYSLSTAWDATTASYANKSYDFGSVLTGDELNCFVFNADGSAVYLAEYSPNRKIYQFTLSTAFDISTATYSNKSLDFASEAVGRPYFQFTNDGTKLFMINTFHTSGFVGKIYEYSLTTAYDISTASYTTVNYAPSGITTGRSALAFKPDGSKMFIMGTDNHTTISQFNLPIYNDNQFVINPSTDSANSGTFTLTISATDGINGAVNAPTNLSLAFRVLNSRYTSLLMNANAAGTNSSFTNSGSGSSAVKGATNNPSAGTFSPFRAGGYSVELDGSDYLKVADSDDFHVSSSADFTLEAWIYLTNLTANNQLVDTRPSGGNGDYFTVAINTSNKIYMYSQSATKVTSAASVPLNQWVHVSYVRASNTGRWYIDGTADTNTWTDNIPYHTSATGADWWIGTRQGSAGSWFTDAKIRDFRFVNGTAIIPPSGGPTEPLTAVTNTKLLACSLPNFADANTQVAAKTITISGDPRTIPNGPYDVSETQLSDGGSIHFDAVGTSGHADAPIEIASVNDGGANHTVSFWYYFTGTASSGATSKGCIYTYGDEQGNVGYGIQHNNANNGQIIFGFGVSPYETVLVTSGAKHSQWNYVQVIKTGTTVRCYLNGVLGTGSGSRSSDYSNGAAELNIGAERYGGMSNLFRGYISDLQYINSASTDYSVPTALRSSTGTVVHLKGETASISDKSQTANLTLVGNTTGSTTQVKFSSTKSVYFDGTGGVICAGSKINTSATASWTAEAWVYLTGSISTEQQIISQFTGGAARFLIGTNNSKFRFFNGGSTIFSTNNISQNTWIHVAATYDGSTAQLYVDGIRQGTVSYSRGVDDTDLEIGARYLTTTPNGTWQGYIQDVRISNGLVRYTAADESSNIPSAPLEG